MLIETAGGTRGSIDNSKAIEEALPKATMRGEPSLSRSEEPQFHPVEFSRVAVAISAYESSSAR
jgi:hypothetical protein